MSNVWALGQAVLCMSLLCVCVCVCYVKNIQLELTWWFVGPGCEDSFHSSNHASLIAFPPSPENAGTGERLRSSGGIKLEKKEKEEHDRKVGLVLWSNAVPVFFSLYSPFSEIRSQGNTSVPLTIRLAYLTSTKPCCESTVSIISLSAKASAILRPSYPGAGVGAPAPVAHSE